MRRHLQPTPPAVVHLSVEEEAILIDEQNQNNVEVNGTIADIDRLGDIIVTVGEVETIVSNTPEIGTAEQELIASVADMAVAGTDVDPQDILPNEESGTVSTESLADTIKDKLAKIWEAIKKAVAKIWEHINTFFAKFKFWGDKVEKKAEKVGEAVKEKPVSKPKAATFTYKGKIHYLCYSGRIPHGNMVQRLKGMLHNVDTVLEKTHGTMTQITDLMDKTVSGMQVNSDAKDLESFQKDFVELTEQLAKNVGGLEKEGDKAMYYTDVMLGQTGVAMSFPATFIDTSAPIGARYAAALHGSANSSAPGEQSSEAEVPFLDDDEDFQISNIALQWCRSLPKHKAYDISGMHNKMNSVEKKVDAMRDRFASGNATADGYKFLNNFALAFPFVDKMTVKLLCKLMDQALMVNNEVLEYCLQSQAAKAKLSEVTA